MRFGLLAVILLVLCSAAVPAFDDWDLERGFKSPPPSARPWVYWFWLNGNITKEGITADLEAMARVGIGGALIMEVDQGAPLGPVAFMSDEWRELFKHVHSEAKRLGIEINMNNDAGWNGSGGPWIKPEQSMQKLVWTETEVEGGKPFDGALPQPKSTAGFYRDVAVLAFPTPGAYRIPGIEQKAQSWGGPQNPGNPGLPSQEKLPDEMLIPRDKVIDLTPKSAIRDQQWDGKLAWNAPAGKWTVLRFGHTSTGAQNRPAHDSGRGLDCDKMSREAVTAHFDAMMKKLAADTGTDKAPFNDIMRSVRLTEGLVATHVDSWEVGSQNWTAELPEAFRKLAGYDPIPYLPVMTGRVVGTLETSERFLWDMRMVISTMIVSNYASKLRSLAHDAGLRFTCEAYGSPCDYIRYGGMSDEPMGEFWMGGGAMETCKGMASAGHVFGKQIIGAEAFTAGGGERWQEHPGSIKRLGDEAFCNGINRFVFHRYAMQPWTPERKPGMTMGPWGLHYERTNTWWELTGPWHTYLSRCQYMLRQGTFVADICYVQNEAPPQTFRGLDRNGYEWDECPAEALIDLASVKDGRVVFPGGMSYRVLALPDSKVMTPRLLRKVRELAKAGATVVGPMPERSPSLSDYPKCDDVVKQIARETWGEGVQLPLQQPQQPQQAGEGVVLPPPVTEHRYGKGRVIWGVSPEDVLRKAGVRQDFQGPSYLRYIHRAAGDTDIYFVSNQQPYATTETCTFRVSGKVPELWWPDSGQIERAAVYGEKDGVTSVALHLGPSGSVFVVFRSGFALTNSKTVDKGFAPPLRVTSVEFDGKPVLSVAPKPPLKITVRKAVYGVLDDPARTRDVIDRVRKKLDAGEYVFKVADMAAGDDPAYGIVKTLIIDFTCEGKELTARGTDPEMVMIGAGPEPMPACEIHDGRLTAWKRGEFMVTGSDGNKTKVAAPALPKPTEIGGPWDVILPDKQVVFDRLISWADHPDPDVRYFSGTATYRTTFEAPDYLFLEGHVVRLDLYDVEVIAQVKLNGKDLGILWKPPFVVDVTGALKHGRNDLEVEVTNLPVNRMIGDEQLPEDSDRNGNGTLKSWPDWLREGKPSPTGRHTFTSWRLWKKDDTLLPSGLLGPVTLHVGYVTTIR